MIKYFKKIPEYMHNHNSNNNSNNNDNEETLQFILSLKTSPLESHV
jgi:hypothetical protein